MNASRFLAVFLSLSCSGSALADDSPWSLGLRAGMSAASGVPSNDSINMAIAVRYALAGGRHAGVAIESMDFDYERPWRVVGREQDTAVEPDDIDSKATSTLFTLFYEQVHGSAGARWQPYWGVAFAVASPDTPPVSGPAQGGGTFDVHTDAGTEYIPGVRAGLRWNLGAGWAADFSASINHHFADWKVEDRQTGNTGRVDDYTHYGAQLGMVYRF